MSEQEKTEAVQSEEQAGEEQPAVEKESSATETEQKPDTSEGEKPAAKESEPAPKEEQPAEEEEPEEEPDDGVPIVLVTGASGFIATHLIKQLLEQGRYRVRGTVRSKKKEEKVIFPLLSARFYV